MTPTDTRAALLAQLDAAQEVLGGEWTAQDGTLPRACNDEHGYRWTASRASNRSAEDLDAVTAALREAWEADGMVVSGAQYADTHRGLVGRSDNVGEIEYSYSLDRISLNAESPCYAGEWLPIYKEEGDKLRDTLKSQTPTPPIP